MPRTSRRTSSSRCSSGRPDGSFRCLLVPGTYLLTVDPPPEYAAPPPARIRVSGPVRDHAVVLAAEGWVEGVVEDADTGERLAGLDVLVLAAGSKRQLAVGAGGSFRCAVRAGKLAVRPALPHGGGYEAAAGGFTGEARQGETVRCVIRCVRSADAAPGFARIRGTVIDPEGRPVAAAVGLKPERSAPGFVETRREAVAGLDGRFELSWSAAEFPARLAAASPFRGLAAEILLERAEDGEDLLVTLETCGDARVEGVVRAVSGTPLPGASIVISRTAEGMHKGAGSVLADRLGRFAIEGLLPSARYQLYPVLEGRYGPDAQVVARAGETIEVEVVVPERDARLEGAVKDLEGRPLPGLMVFYEYLQDELPIDQAALTGEDGRFSVPGLFPGKYLVRIDGPGYAGAWANVETSEPPREFILEPARRVRLSLLEPDGFPVAAIYLSGESGESATRRRMLLAEDGLYEFEIPVRERAIKILAYLQDPEARPELRFPLGQPVAGVLDLGTIIVEDAGAAFK